MLAVSALNQSYGGSHTLWDVDLEVPTGSRTCLMGRNGMGKTTLLKCIMGLLPATSGTHRCSRAANLRQAGGRGARAGSASATCRRAARSFRSSPSKRTSRWGSASARTGVKKVPDLIFELFPVLKQMLQPARRRSLRADSNSSSRSDGRWCSSRRC